MKKTLSIYIFFLKLLILIFILKELINSNYKLSILYSIVFLIYVISYFFKNKFNLKYLYFFENLSYLLIFSYEFNLLYKNIPFWDTGMHAFTGFIFVIFIYFIFYILKKLNKLKKLNPFLIAFLGFCFSLTIGTLFELMEYSFDNLKNIDMQKDMIVSKINTVKFSKDDLIKIDNIKKTIIYYQDDNDLKEFSISGYLDIGIHDTMKDLFVNLIGALMASLYIYFYLKQQEKDKKIIEK